jgi:hypothetical protein
MPAITRPRAPIKKALCVSVEYRELADAFPDLGLHLPATHKDSVMMSGLLQEYFGYRPENIQILTDAKGSDKLPTRENIISSMHELVGGAQPGDRLVFHFSGHGSQVPAPPEHVEETDGFDEVIWPCDVQGSLDEDGTLQVEDYILDDDIKKILVDSLPAGVRLAIVFDSCSSGTCADLPFSCGSSSVSSPIDPRAINFSRPIQVRAAPIPMARQRSRSIVDLGYNVDGLTPKRRVTVHSTDEWSSGETDPEASPIVTSWAACLDDQSTLESSLGSVFLRALAASLKNNPQQTNLQMLDSITTWLQNNIPWPKLEQQPPKPQLCCNLRIDLIYHATFEF